MREPKLLAPQRGGRVAIAAFASFRRVCLFLLCGTTFYAFCSSFLVQISFTMFLPPTPPLFCRPFPFLCAFVVAAPWIFTPEAWTLSSPTTTTRWPRWDKDTGADIALLSLSLKLGTRGSEVAFSARLGSEVICSLGTHCFKNWVSFFPLGSCVLSCPSTGRGKVRLRAVGELLPPHGPPPHQGVQDVQEPQELHHHQAGLGRELLAAGRRVGTGGHRPADVTRSLRDVWSESFRCFGRRPICGN